jgi:hypothetical protein
VNTSIQYYVQAGHGTGCEHVYIILYVYRLDTGLVVNTSIKYYIQAGQRTGREYVCITILYSIYKKYLGKFRQ